MHYLFSYLFTGNLLKVMEAADHCLCNYFPFIKLLIIQIINTYVSNTSKINQISKINNQQTNKQIKSLQIIASLINTINQATIQQLNHHMGGNQQSNNRSFTSNLQEQQFNSIILQGKQHPTTKFTRVENCYRQPYWAIGEIKTNFDKGLSIRGTGVLISKKHVLTVAHNNYNHKHKLEGLQTFFYPQVWRNGKKQKIQIKVKQSYFSRKYITSAGNDQRFYDIAILELVSNPHIKDNQFLQILPNWKNTEQLVLIAGYPNKLNLKQGEEYLNDYDAKMFQNTNRILALYQNFAQYLHASDNGISGAPLLINDGGKYKIIGLHQGNSITSNLRLALLISGQLQNSLTILQDLMKDAGKTNFPPVQQNPYHAISNSQSQIKKELHQNQKGLQLQPNQQRQKKYVQIIQKQRATIETLQNKIEALEKSPNINNKPPTQKYSKEEVPQMLIKEPQIYKKQINEFDIPKKAFKIQFGVGQNIALKSFQQQQTKVDLSGSQITDIQLKKLSQQLPKMQYLNLYACQQLQNIVLAGYKRLKKLDMSYIKIIELELKQFPELEQLILLGCQQLKNIRIVNCKKLKKLDLRDTNISQSTYAQFRKQFPQTYISY